jgi:hypothetical protein
MDQSSTDANEREVVNYVPDEVCIVVAIDGTTDGAALYEHVRNRLNQRLVELLRSYQAPSRAKRQAAAPGNPLALDLTPQRLSARFRQDEAPLQPLKRNGVRPKGPSPLPPDGRAPREVPPWIALRRERGTTWHLYYQVGRDRVGLDSTSLAQRGERMDCIRELVLLLNGRLPGAPIDRFRKQSWSVTAASPNWLTAALPFSCGSPAGLPISAAPSGTNYRGTLSFPDEALVAALKKPRRGEVIVAVLDTCPDQKLVRKRSAALPNDFLKEVVANVPMNKPALVPDLYFSNYLSDCLPRLQWNMLAGPVEQHPDRFQMADHGLFALGLIYELMPPRSKLHLIRVLNDFGIGDLLAITHALIALPKALLGTETPGPKDPRLVVNLSLGAEIPIPSRLVERWLPATARDAQTMASRLPDLCTVLDGVHSNLSDAASWLAERGVLVVAAAGNDALRQDVAPGEPPPPRYPARYADVLGVASMRRDLRSPAAYSNRGDVLSQVGSGHISTFGGNVVPATSDTASATTSPDDSVVGIFSSPLPGGAPNTTGWARWSGTSFSTPIIAGIAARLWATTPAQMPGQVAATLRTFAHDPHGGIDPDSPLEVPVLPVTQA